MPAGMFRTALILGSICVTGPFAIDMYLPALPAIEEALDVSVSAAQITLVAYFLAYGVSQTGLWAAVRPDRGAKRPLPSG